MSRPLRIAFPDALYHVTSRGDRREAIFEDDADRGMFLEIFEEVIGRFNWICHAWCLMDNHYHLLVQTPDANLSKGMRQLNGVYTQASNRRHGRVGHLFQGRFKAILVDGDAYLMEVARYVVLNPVRARMVKDPAKWPWSSYRASVGMESAPPWLKVDGVLAMFGRSRRQAQARYARFVVEGVRAPSPWAGLKAQVFLGDDAFVQRMQARMEVDVREDVQIPVAQRRTPAPSLAEIAQDAPDRDAAIVAAHATGAYSYHEIAGFFGIHFTTVGRIVRRGGRCYAARPDPDLLTWGGS